MNEAANASTPYSELVGIYHADGSLIGELRYVLGKIRGTAHCALCDITHGLVTQKAEFKNFKTRLDIPFRALHLDERDPELLGATEERTPCVVGRTEGGEWTLVLDHDELEACGKSVEAFEEKLREKLEPKAG